MAVGCHVVSVRKKLENNEMVRRIVEDGDVTNSSGSPTVSEYISAEAADGYLVNVFTEHTIVTLNSADL